MLVESANRSYDMIDGLKLAQTARSQSPHLYGGRGTVPLASLQRARVAKMPAGCDLQGVTA